MSICSIDNCNLEAYENDNKCILHCEKHKYSVDFHKIGFLRAFYDELLNFIIESLKNRKNDTRYNEKNLRAYFTDRQTNTKYISTDPFRNDVVVFSQIFFPQSKDIDSFEYKKLLRKLGEIHFNYCEFSVTYIDLNESHCFFQDCKFHNGLLLYNLKVLENESDVLFQECEFKDKVTSFSEEAQGIIEASLFSDCTFTKIEFEYTMFKKPIFNNVESIDNKIHKISFRDCNVESNLKLDYYNVQNLNIVNTTFNTELEAYKLRVADFSIQESKFKGLVNFYNCNLNNLYINKSNFEELVGFQYCHFKGKAIFENVTFLSFVNMKNTNFLDGLDMSETNLKEYPNFLDSNIDTHCTNKETFRIIKHSFDKIGNISEANRYFTYEMAKEMKETLFFKNPAKKTMLVFNMLLSNFGQWYLLPLMWLILLLPFHEWIVDNSIPNSFEYLNKLVKNILPIKRFLNTGTEFISLLFYIVYSVLIYHFIISVKRVTKR